MVRKLSLPLTFDAGNNAAKTPAVDLVRKRLGGRASTEPGAGDLVALTTDGGSERVGVVLFVRGDALDIWVDHGLVRRTRRSSIRPLKAPIAKELADVAGDARVFGGLLEGQRVRYQHEAGFGEGMLVEKCRFGALLERDDGVLVGVGFRRIWPAATEAEGEQN